MMSIDELLPGRTAAEDQALSAVKHAVEIAQRHRGDEVGQPLPATDRGRLGRRERLTSLQQKVADAEAALRTKAEQLVADRLAHLPIDATDIHHGDGASDVSDDGRYAVVCASGGQRVSLGGCPTLGAAQDRVRWFQAKAEERRRG